MASGSKSAGKIIKPGYHLRPTYDLHGLRMRRTGQGKGGIAGELPLTSLIDMFSILVIYLLMNFSATGEIFFQNKGLALPKAQVTNEMRSSPLVSLVGSDFVLDVPQEYGGDQNTSDSTPELSQLTLHLKELRTIATDRGLNSQDRVNIQADEDTPIGEVKRAMSASVSAGWTNLNFVVEKK
jgi:biopolymer transport protein ExbD